MTTISKSYSSLFQALIGFVVHTRHTSSRQGMTIANQSVYLCALGLFTKP